MLSFLVCFQHADNYNMVFGQIATSKMANPPRSFYFGHMGNDDDACEQACREVPECAARTLYSERYDSSEWRGECYGRGFHDDVAVFEEHVAGGVVSNCDNGTVMLSTLYNI